MIKHIEDSPHEFLGWRTHITSLHASWNLVLAQMPAEIHHESATQNEICYKFFSVPDKLVLNKHHNHCNLNSLISSRCDRLSLNGRSTSCSLPLFVASPCCSLVFVPCHGMITFQKKHVCDLLHVMHALWTSFLLDCRAGCSLLDLASRLCARGGKTKCICELHRI